jgi:O-antigen ligase
VFASAALMLLCLLFTRSRAGIATALMGLVFSSILFVRARSGSRHAKPIVVALVVTGIALAALIGLTPLLERLEPGQLRLSGEGRLALYAATLRGAIEFLPFGSGLSTYASVFPRFQEGVGGAYYDFAHNDYLQLVMETGIAGAVAVALLLVAYLMRMADLVIRGSERSFTLLQVAAGVGLAPLILHSAFDFSLHMPGIAVWFATLAGAMLHPGVRDAARDSAGGRRRSPGASRREGAGADETAP